MMRTGPTLGGFAEQIIKKASSSVRKKQIEKKVGQRKSVKIRIIPKIR